MSQLLSSREYHALVDSLDFPLNAFIDDGYRAPINSHQYDTINPPTDEKITSVAACDRDDVDYAVHKAGESFDEVK